MDAEQATRALAALRLAAQHVQASRMLPSYAREAFTAAHQMITWQADQAARQALQLEALRLELQELRGKVGAPVMITNTPAGAVVESAPAAWLDGAGHPHHVSSVQSATERRVYGQRVPLFKAGG